MATVLSSSWLVSSFVLLSIIYVGNFQIRLCANPRVKCTCEESIHQSDIVNAGTVLCCKWSPLGKNKRGREPHSSALNVYTASASGLHCASLGLCQNWPDMILILYYAKHQNVHIPSRLMIDVAFPNKLDTAPSDSCFRSPECKRTSNT